MRHFPCTKICPFLHKLSRVGTLGGSIIVGAFSASTSSFDSQLTKVASTNKTQTTPKNNFNFIILLIFAQHLVKSRCEWTSNQGNKIETKPVLAKIIPFIRQMYVVDLQLRFQFAIGLLLELIRIANFMIKSLSRIWREWKNLRSLRVFADIFCHEIRLINTSEPR